MKDYRNNIEKAISFFRPVLASLSLRKIENQRSVYIAEFDRLEFLELDNMKITVVPAKLETGTGLFFYRNTNELVDCYIIINSNLYEKSLEEVKFTGVHEFVHLMALVYLLTSTGVEHQREILAKRMEDKIDSLNKDSLNRFIKALSQEKKAENFSVEFGDKHFRLNDENMDLDYSDLFNHFMLSKELFEVYFTLEHQQTFSKMLENKKASGKAVEFYGTFIEKAEKDKNIPHEMAFNQAISWVNDYLK